MAGDIPEDAGRIPRGGYKVGEIGDGELKRFPREA
jgi:hypothetical protein